MTDTVDAQVYLQIAPEYSDYQRSDGLKTVWGARLRKATQRRPSKQEAGTVLVQLTVRLPKSAFQPLRPKAVVVVPEELIQDAVEVEAC